MRLFVAIEFPRDVRRELWADTAPLREEPFPVRWVGEDRLHLTLKFLGEVEEGRVDDVAGALARAARPSRPFALRVEGVGAFPSLERPRVVWLGVEAPGELASVQTRVEEELAELGFDRERRDFHPHVTLGRVRREARRGALAGLEEAAAGIDVSAESRVEEVTLMRSVLKSGGAEYSAVRSHELGEGPLGEGPLEDGALGEKALGENAPGEGA